ncbi:6156_t:CDS:2, partial [Entrophospora sp. SA101]
NGSSKDKKVIKKMRKDSEEEEEQNVFVGEIRRIKNKPEDINLVILSFERFYIFENRYLLRSDCSSVWIRKFEGEFMVFVTVKVKELRSLMGNLTHWEYVLNENEDNHEISMDADRFVISLPNEILMKILKYYFEV